MLFNVERAVSLQGQIKFESVEKLMKEIVSLYKADRETPIHCVLTTGGGSSDAGQSFFDFVTTVKIPLWTYALGQVSSAGIVMFLAGEKRFVSKHTYMVIHEVTLRDPDVSPRSEYLATAKGLSLCSDFYCDILASRSSQFTAAEWSDTMLKRAVLDPDQIVEYGIAHEIWTGQ